MEILIFGCASNVEALEQAPIDQEDKEVILDMVRWLRDVPRTPGQYLLERSISDIWNTMVFDGTSAQVAADEKVIAINREIKKKMQELGFYDDEGNMIKSYIIRDAEWIQEQMDNAKKGVSEHASGETAKGIQQEGRQGISASAAIHPFVFHIYTDTGVDCGVSFFYLF